MPTFKLEEMDEDLPYGGDNDMYFRQWRLPSMKPVLDEKLDRDFQDAVAKKEELMQQKTERRQKHSAEFDKKFENLVKQMKEASVNDRKENIPFLRQPTDLELKNARDDLEKEFASPSSTARMVPFAGKLRPRQNPIFGEKMVGLKNLVLPPPHSKPPSLSTPSFSAHETVFYPQTHDSFNLDNYNGSRPSFAFSGNAGATSTPVSKGIPFVGGIAEEDGDDSVFEQSKYVTAMESPIRPIQKTSEIKKVNELPKLEAKKAEIPVEKPKIPEIDSEKPSNPNRFGRGLLEKATEKPPESAAFSDVFGQISADGPKFSEKDGFSSLFGSKATQKPAEVESKTNEGAGFGALFNLKPAGNTGLFGQKPSSDEPKKEEKPGFGSLFNLKPAQNSIATETKPIGSSGIFGLKPVENKPADLKIEEKPPLKTGFGSLFNLKPAKTSSIFDQKPASEKPKLIENEVKSLVKPKVNLGFNLVQNTRQETEAEDLEKLSWKITETPEEKSEPATELAKTVQPPHVVFRNFIGLQKNLLEDKAAYEKSSDPQFRTLVKRTITEKVTVFTQRQTSSEARGEILEFFKTLLAKKEVIGFAVIGDGPRFQLKTDEDVNYSVYCIVEKYISLAELDEDLAPAISDLISRLGATVRRVEKVFIVLMFNKSTLLRQHREECYHKFVEHATAENSDEKAIEWNQEKALAILFFTVFTKNAFFSSKGRAMKLSEELLWKYVDSTMEHALNVPKSSFILLQLITTCKPRLAVDKKRWDQILNAIETEKLPELEANPFIGDEAVISNLRQMLAAVRA